MKDYSLATARKQGGFVVILLMIGLAELGSVALFPVAAEPPEDQEIDDSTFSLKALGTPGATAHQFAAVLLPGKEGFRFARNLERKAFHDRNQQFNAEGFVLQNIEVWPGNRFSGLWSPRPDRNEPQCGGAAGDRNRPEDLVGSVQSETPKKLPNFLLAATRKELLVRHASEADKGKQLVDVEVYQRGTQQFFAGVWQDCAPELDLVFGLSAEEVRELAPVRKVVDIESQDDGRFVALLGGPPRVPQIVQVGRTFKELETDLDIPSTSGLALTEFEIFEFGVQPRYAYVLDKTEEQFWFVLGIGPEAERFHDCRILSLGLESGELRARDPDACRALGKRSNIKHCVETPPANGKSQRESVSSVERGPIALHPTVTETALQPAEPRSSATNRSHGQYLLGPDSLRAVELGCLSFHLVDFSATRRSLIHPLPSCTPCPPHHPGHLVVDIGPAGPGNPDT